MMTSGNGRNQRKDFQGKTSLSVLRRECALTPAELSLRPVLLREAAGGSERLPIGFPTEKLDMIKIPTSH